VVSTVVCMLICTLVPSGMDGCMLICTLVSSGVDGCMLICTLVSGSMYVNMYIGI
jgi:hypothetical protein